MSRIIKKSVLKDKPVIISKEPVKDISSKNNETVSVKSGQSLFFSEIIKSEIDNLTEKVAPKVQSHNQHRTQEIEKAFHEGYEKGLVNGIEQERSNQIKAVDVLLKEAKKKSMDSMRGLEINIIRLVSVIVEKMIRKSLTADPALVEHIVTETMSYIIGSEKVVIKVSPENFKTINSKYDKWLDMAGNASEFRIEIDKRLRTGDCLVETDESVIDSVVSDRIDVLVEELLKVSQ